MSRHDPAAWRRLALALAVLVVGCHERDKGGSRAAPPPPAFGVEAARTLPEEAARLVREGRPDQARSYALKANAVVRANANPWQPAPSEDGELLRRLTAVLSDVGEYETAMSLVLLEPPADQQAGYRFLMLHIIDARNRSGIHRVLPTVATLLATAPSSALEGATDLADVIRRLALTGFVREARAANIALDPRRALLPPSQRLRLQADLGDVKGAVTAANNLGPLTERTSPMADAPTSAPRADALAAIATDLAEAGRIQDAIAVAHLLDAPPPQAVASSRDFALAAIAEAQAKHGDVVGAGRTIALIYQPRVRSMSQQTLACASCPGRPNAPAEARRRR